MTNLVEVKNNEIILNNDFIESYKEFQKIKLNMELREKEFKQELKEAMESLGKKDLILDGFSANIRKGSTRTTLDSRRLKEELPDVYHEYSKTTETKSSIMIKVD